MVRLLLFILLLTGSTALFAGDSLEVAGHSYPVAKTYTLSAADSGGLAVQVDSAGMALSNLAVFNTILDTHPMLSNRKVPEEGTPRIRINENKTGIFFITILLLYVFGGIRLMFAHQFSGSLSMVSHLRNIPKKQAENDTMARLSFYALYFITLGFMAFYYLSYYHKAFGELPMLIGIVLAIGAVTVLYLLRSGAMYLLAWIFDKLAMLREYNHNVMITYKLSAITLFPIVIMVLLSGKRLGSVFIGICLFLLIGAILLRYIRNAGLLKKLIARHFFHFLMYLCAFEIIPLLLIIKLFG